MRFTKLTLTPGSSHTKERRSNACLVKLAVADIGPCRHSCTTVCDTHANAQGRSCLRLCAQDKTGAAIDVATPQNPNIRTHNGTRCTSGRGEHQCAHSGPMSIDDGHATQIMVVMISTPQMSPAMSIHPARAIIGKLSSSETAPRGAKDEEVSQAWLA